MSPTEFDLRAALHDGEGDRVDVDRVVAGGQARRAQRRIQVLSTSAVVVFVAAASTGAALLWGGSDSGGPVGSNADRRAAGGQVGDARRAAPSLGSIPAATDPSATMAASAPARRDAAIACPTSMPHLLLPGGGSPGQFGSDGPMFAKPVDSIVVCSYGSPLRAAGPVRPARLVLTGGSATALATSLENASKTNASESCASIRPADEHSLAIIGVTAKGTELATITTTLTSPPCNVQVTNGTAVRYDWAPPAGLQVVLSTLTPRPAGNVTVPRVPPTGRNIGSPVH